MKTRTHAVNELADLIFGPPKKQPKIPVNGIPKVYGIPAETLLDADDDEGPARDMVVTVRACKPRKVSTGRNRFVPYAHLTKDNPEIKKFAGDPESANRFCVIRDGKPYSPRTVNREIEPRFDFGAMGSLKDARFALTMLVLNPPITAIACYPLDAEPVFFPVDPDQARDVSGRAPEKIPATGKSEPEESVREPAELDPGNLKASNPRSEASDATEVNSDAPRGNSGGTGSDNAL